MDLVHLSVVIAVGVIGSLLARPLAIRYVVAPRVRRLAAEGRLECGLRTVSGEVPGLAGRWLHGTAELHGRTLRLRPGPLGLRWATPWRSEVVLLVDEVAAQRAPAWTEALTVSTECRILRVRAGDAEVEWAVLSSQVDWVLRQVGGPPDVD